MRATILLFVLFASCTHSPVPTHAAAEAHKS